MARVLDSTYGILLITLFLENILYGCGLLQVWLYFHWYPKDRWGIKTMVILLVIFETLQITLFFAATYRSLIKNFGNVPLLWEITWSDAAQLLAGFLSAFTVQLYFAYCLYILNRKQKIVPILIVILALTSIGAGLAQTIITSTRSRSFLHIQDTRASYTLQSAATLACDIVITVSLLRNLGGHKNKNSPEATNNMLDKLMINAINRGVLTALCAAINIIIFLSIPNTFWFFIPSILLSSKLYMNSALASLNSRQYIKDSSAYPSTDPNDWNFPLIGLPITPVQAYGHQIRPQS